MKGNPVRPSGLQNRRLRSLWVQIPPPLPNLSRIVNQPMCRLWRWQLWVLLHWSVKPVLVGSTPTRHPKFDVVGIVQRSERRPVTPNAVGSNPTVHPKFLRRESTTEMIEGGTKILNSGDGSSPSVQRRTGLVAPSGQDWSDVHIELPSSKGKTLATVVGSPLDHECPACEAPKGVACRSATTHYDRVRLIRI